jgi:Family of unknown function (DUF6529)
MTHAASELPAAQATRSARWLVLPLLLGALVSLTAGLLAREEAITPGAYPGGYFRLFFSDSLHLKVWFATAALALGVTQLFSAAWIFGKLPWRRPPFVPAAHRWLGRLAFACTLPVAYHCIFKLGFQTTSGRVVAHSLFGCAFYGAFAAKVTIVRLHRYPRWVLPTAGGLLFAVLLGVWYTSAFWFFRTIGVGL